MPAVFQTLQKTRNTSKNSNLLRRTPDALDLLEQFGTTVVVKREREICGEGEPAEFCWRILSGCVRTVKCMEDGRRQIGEFLWQGDFLGIDDLDLHDFNAEAVTDVTLRCYPRRMVEALAQSHTALAMRLRMMTVGKLRQTYQHMITLGRSSASEKIAYFLLEMSRRSKSADRQLLNVPMSRTDIADYLGMTIETVCRTLARLRQDDILSVSHSCIELRDRAALLGLARTS